MTSLNILVADDDTQLGAFVSYVLRKAGHRVEVVLDGDEALTAIEEKPTYYHMLVTDHNMPKLNGLELVTRLRQKAFPGRIVVLSGFLTDELEQAYGLLDVDCIIRKPFDIVIFRDAIKKLGGASVWHRHEIGKEPGSQPETSNPPSNPPGESA